MNSKIYHSLWPHNSKKHTVISYLYLFAAFTVLMTGDAMTASILMVLSELNKVDKAARIAACDTANQVINEGDQDGGNQ